MARQVVKKISGKQTPISDKKGIKVNVPCPKTINDIKVHIKPGDEPNVSEYSLNVLKEILMKACLRNARITSTIRNAREQAEAMYQNLYQKKNPNYNEPGKEVCKIFHQLKNENKTSVEIISAMKEKIDVLMANGKIVSKHVNQENTLYYNVFDVSPKSLVIDAAGKEKGQNSDRDKVYNIAHNDKRVKKILDLPHGNDPALHFEIPQPIAFDDAKLAAIEKKNEKPLSPMAKAAIEEARGLDPGKLKYANKPYVFYDGQ